MIFKKKLTLLFRDCYENQRCVVIRRHTIRKTEKNVWGCENYTEDREMKVLVFGYLDDEENPRPESLVVEQTLPDGRKYLSQQIQVWECK